MHGASREGPLRNSLRFLGNGAVWVPRPVTLYRALQSALLLCRNSTSRPMIVRGCSETLIVTATAMRAMAVDERRTL
jgi:hypothetical protein